MADDANQTPPRLPLLLAQRLAEVGERAELVRRSALPELGAADLPAADAAREAEVLNRRRAAERVLEPELVGEAADQVRSFASEQPLAEAVDEHETPFAVEREDRDVDLGHDRAQQHRGFLRAEPLAAERLGQRVDLEHHLPERVVRDGAAGADREVVFTQGCQEIRDRLQRPDDSIAQRQRDTEPQPGEDRWRRSPV